MSDEVAPRLDRIERYSDWLRADADGVVHNVRTLPRQRSYETRAEHSLKVAKERLEGALAEVNQALTDFAAKPVEETAAA